MKYPPSCTIIRWSNNFTSIASHPATIFFVIALSASDGSKFPLGWLWATMIEEALVLRAYWRSCLTSTIVPVVDPLVIVVIPNTLLFLFKNSALNSSKYSIVFLSYI